jgi:tetratricopeptide (TPR) repeat protein
MPFENDWLLPLATMALALGAGFALWHRTAARRARTGADPVRSAGVTAGALPTAGGAARAELELERDALLARLRELAAAGEDAAATASERQDLERRAAAVLRRLEETAGAAGTAAAPVGSAAPPPAATRHALRGFAWGLATAAVLGLLVALVWRSASPRAGSDPISGGPGGDPEAASRAGLPTDAEVQALADGVERDPEDVEARMELAVALLARGDLMGVFEQTREVLERRPDHPRALAYQALVRLAMGEPEAALQMLDRALAAQPDLLDAWVHLVVVNMQLGRYEEAERAIVEIERLHPDADPLLAELRQAVARRRSDRSGPGELPPAHPPLSGAEPSGGAPAAAVGDSGVSGTLELAPGAAGRLPPGAVLFVVARPEGRATGPPVAVSRLAADSFPVAFRIDQGDSMMGQELPSRLRLEARIDLDGNATTRDPSEPMASRDGVPLGAAGVTLVLE